VQADKHMHAVFSTSAYYCAPSNFLAENITSRVALVTDKVIGVIAAGLTFIRIKHRPADRQPV